MKQKPIKDYSPKYPRKLLKGAILTTAAAVALTGTAGCELRTAGVPLAEPEPTDELVLDGEVGYELPEDDPTLLGGEPLPDDACEEEDGDFAVRDGEPALQGKIVVPEENP